MFVMAVNSVAQNYSADDIDKVIQLEKACHSLADSIAAFDGVYFLPFFHNLLATLKYHAEYFI